jgi:pimeloyl-ACP methyl ester carboxylesterase
MPIFLHDGLTFHYRTVGAGLPFVFQHGLGGDVSQPIGLFQPPPGVQMLCLDCRAHGQTRPLGDPEKIALTVFAEDLGAWLDHLGIERAVLGGTSMGAAVTLHFALRFPSRVAGLVLSRPAWLDGPMPANVAVFARIARLIREHGTVRGLDLFQQSPDYLDLLATAPDSARSLAAQFTQPQAEEAVVKLERIPNEAPCRDLRDLQALRVPTLVLANRQDPIHPFEYGEALACAIPGAEFQELASKSVSVDQHTADVQRALTGFLQRHFLG